jgi:hypothetical protein
MRLHPRHADAATSENPLAVTNSAPGTVVGAAAARKAIEHSGFRIRWRSGPTPKPFVAALYGTAEGRRRIKVNFGYFFAGTNEAQRLLRRSLAKLVPHATEEGSSASVSFVAITSAGSSGKPPSSSWVYEELHIANTLQRKVSKLAPVAHGYEGP